VPEIDSFLESDVLLLCLEFEINRGYCMQPLSGWDLSYWLRSAYVLVMVCGSCTALAFILVSIMTFNPCTDFCKFSQFREYTRTLRKEEISRVVLVSFILVGFS
jgi:hypothetical protein